MHVQSPSPFTAKYENKNLLGFMYPRNVFHKNNQPAFLVLTRTPGCFRSSSEFSFGESRKAKSLGRLEQLLRALVLGQGTKASSGKAYPKLLVRTLMSHKLTTSTRKRRKEIVCKLAYWTKGAGSFHIYRKTMKELGALAVLGVREQPNSAQNWVTHRHWWKNTSRAMTLPL